MEIDREEKITPFDYEWFLPKGYLESVDKDSPEFKRKVKELAFEARTEYEEHLDNQAEFKQQMGILGYLTEQEGRDYIHLLNNNKWLHKLITLHSGRTEQKLAKIVENEKFNQKNRYWNEW